MVVPTRASVLTIAGSDSGGGAGIQADLKTITALGLHAATAITAVTAQNSRHIIDIMTVSLESLERQIDAVMSDLKPVAVKTGMLVSAEIVALVARKMREWKPRFLVVDPVMISTSGTALLNDEAIEVLKTELLPLATVITPNWDETAALINAYPRGLVDIERIALSFERLGAPAVLVKGGHIDESETVTDTLWESGTFHSFEHPRIANAQTHGSGCILASAIASGLASGRSLPESVGKAIDLVSAAIAARYASGDSRQVFLPLATGT
ncbi:MAG TPA: bifunctional hydroxymethylpyrimidine kinase/phosphomethylpyrimidine kinase [Thermoanaerobaculia bacterium]|nr:bifunctional hydroxymethylpyrimidine kinase/phosphomethylpyrimidine kinase [Thermoanaerobaculia bacterium]